MTNAVKWILAATFVCLVGVSLVTQRWLLGKPSAAQAKPSSGEVVERASKGHPSGGRARESLASRWHLGSQVAFDLDFSSWLEEGGEGPRLMAITASSPLTLTVVQSPHQTRLLAGNAEALAVSFEDADIGPEARDRVRADLKRPFYIEFAETGVVPAVYFAPGQDHRSDRLLRDLVSVLQFVKPEDHRANGWTTQETGSNGFFRAHYARQRDLVEKRKDPTVLPLGVPPNTKLESVAKYVLDRDLFIERVTLQERVEFPIGAVLVRAFLNIGFKFRAQRLTAAATPNLTGYLRTPLDGSRSPTKDPRQTDEERAKGQSLAGLSEELVDKRPNKVSAEYRCAGTPGGTLADQPSRGSRVPGILER